jgi:hypothetical protein
MAAKLIVLVRGKGGIKERISRESRIAGGLTTGERCNENFCRVKRAQEGTETAALG